MQMAQVRLCEPPERQLDVVLLAKDVIDLLNALLFDVSRGTKHFGAPLLVEIINIRFL